MKPKAEVVRQATKDGISVHFALLVDLCLLQHGELAKHLQKYKGRVVLRRNTVKDDTRIQSGIHRTGRISFTRTTEYPRTLRFACRKLPDC